MWKYLRIAVTAVSLLVCVLLIVLWVRSYYHSELIGGNVFDSFRFVCVSFHKCFQLVVFRDSNHLQKDWSVLQVPAWADEVDSAWWLASDQNWLVALRVPYWFLVVISATVAALPWIKWRFSLRTLLIVMTLFSLLFGAVAWSL